jgi:hypothetical protein
MCPYGITLNLKRKIKETWVRKNREEQPTINYLNSQIVRYFSKCPDFLQSFPIFLTVAFELLNAGTSISDER